LTAIVVEPWILSLIISLTLLYNLVSGINLQYDDLEYFIKFSIGLETTLINPLILDVSNLFLGSIPKHYLDNIRSDYVLNIFRATT